MSAPRAPRPPRAARPSAPQDARSAGSVPAAPPLFALDDETAARHAARAGTPCFVYHGPTARGCFTALRSALPPRVRLAYAVKANPHPDLLRCLFALGASFDAASVGELRRLHALGVPGERIFFAGPGKRESELRFAVALGARVQAEGWEDLERLDALAGGLDRAALPLAVNVRIHPLQAPAEASPILGGSGPSAFGVDEEDLPALLQRCAALARVRLAGLHVFAASNQRDSGPLLASHAHTFAIGRRLQEEHGLPLEQIDLGGGLGVPYAAGETPLDLAALGGGLQRLLDEQRWFTGEVILEPGRFLAAACGTYLARVVRTKRSRGVRFAILEGGINHLLRPALTGQPFPVRVVGPRAARAGDALAPTVLAGPLCTSLDRLGEALLPELRPGDLLAFGMAGAYGFTEAMPAFLSHPPPPEIWVD